MLNVLCEGSLEDFFHIYPAVTAKLLPVISLLLLIREQNPDQQLTDEWRR